MARLFLIDSFGYIFRAYHARARSGAPPMHTASGLSTEAVFIFHNMIRKLKATYQPEYLAAVFESRGPTFRDQAFEAYKANRTEMPADLAEQIPWVEKMLGAMRIPVLQFEGYEADDVIGAVARRAEQAGVEVVIVSSDKDMMQLVSGRISMLNPAKDEGWYDPPKVKQFMGVPPEQVADLLALKGDAVDNIPGAPGIGEKGAVDLILEFGSVEAALERAAEVKKRTYRESLEKNREQILLSKKLATIDTGVPIEWTLEGVAGQEPDKEALRQIFKELEFFSLLKELGGEEEAPQEEYRALADDEEPSGGAVAFFDGQVGLASEAGAGMHAPVERVRAYLEDVSRPKIACDLKALAHALGFEPGGFTRDVMLEGFLLAADPAACTLEAMCERLLDRKPGARADERADLVFRLAERFGPEIESQGLAELYRTIEMPLIPVLKRMEDAGIRVAPAELARLSKRMEGEISWLTSEIHALAGREFNINSPQQLGKLLFEEMRLPMPARYGKGKTVSTAADVLEELANVHPIAGKVLEYRGLAKLKNTYVDTLPGLIRPGTGRVHTTFNQTGAATGRLSSSNPNLQNIPVRTELGREIRAAFVPREGWKLITADYSQIELRLLAHMSRDPVLVEAFRHGEDIHTRTAAEVFGIMPLMVTPEMRRMAKAVNFGIVYGQTPFGLAQALGISRDEAQRYIEDYFTRYAGVKKFIDASIAEVRKSGVAVTLFGRRRPIPDIQSKNPNARGFAERTAVNTPLQGTAADLIKLAMIRIDGLLRSQAMESRMLLQVHDELVFEAPPAEIDELKKMVKREMETARKLDVPLLVETGIGDNWRDAK